MEITQVSFHRYPFFHYLSEEQGASCNDVNGTSVDSFTGFEASNALQYMSMNNILISGLLFSCMLTILSYFRSFKIIKCSTWTSKKEVWWRGGATEAEVYGGVYRQHLISVRFYIVACYDLDLFFVSLAISGVQHELLKNQYDEECELLKKKYLEECTERKRLYN